jgi:dTDP-glucose pyrophosphorylase
MTREAIPETATLRDAVAAIEAARKLICAVVAADGKLLGVLSDGDIRRALLKGAGLDAPAVSAMTRTPIVGPADATPAEAHAIMAERGVAAIPLIDTAGRFARVAQISDDRTLGWTGGELFEFAVIMAGGEGRRLRPLTIDLPKPMIDVGGMPLLERQVRAMVAGGLRRIYVSTNYLGHMIEDHFGDGTAFGARIDYLRERERLGTAGALSLLPARPARPILVVNGDVLTTCDFGNLFRFHAETAAMVTVAASIYRVEIPYGVLRVRDHELLSIDEKPTQRFLCNAGIYALSPAALDLVPSGRVFDMPELLSGAMRAGRVGVFPIHEYWSDIGSPADLARALAEFSKIEE